MNDSTKREKRREIFARRLEFAQEMAEVFIAAIDTVEWEGTPEGLYRCLEKHFYHELWFPPEENPSRGYYEPVISIIEREILAKNITIRTKDDVICLTYLFREFREIPELVEHYVSEGEIMELIELYSGIPIGPRKGRMIRVRRLYDFDMEHKDVLAHNNDGEGGSSHAPLEVRAHFVGFLDRADASGRV